MLTIYWVIYNFPSLSIYRTKFIDCFFFFVVVRFSILSRIGFLFWILALHRIQATKHRCEIVFVLIPSKCECIAACRPIRWMKSFKTNCLFWLRYKIISFVGFFFFCFVRYFEMFAQTIRHRIDSGTADIAIARQLIRAFLVDALMIDAGYCILCLI